MSSGGARVGALGGRGNSPSVDDGDEETVSSSPEGFTLAQALKGPNMHIEEETEDELDSEDLLGADVELEGGRRVVVNAMGGAASGNGSSSFFKIPGRSSRLQRTTDSSLRSLASTPSTFTMQQSRSILHPFTNEFPPTPSVDTDSSPSTFSGAQSFFASPGKSPRNDRRPSKESSFSSRDDGIESPDVKVHKKGKGIESVVKNKSSGDGKMSGLMRSLKNGFRVGPSVEAASSSSTTLDRIPPVQPSLHPNQSTLRSHTSDFAIEPSLEVQHAREQSIAIGGFRLDRKGKIIGYGSGIGNRRGSKDTVESGSGVDSRRGSAASQGSRHLYNEETTLQASSSSPSRVRLLQSPTIKDYAMMEGPSPTKDNQTPPAMHATFVRAFARTKDSDGGSIGDRDVSPTCSPKTMTTMLRYPPTPSSSAAVTATSKRLSSMSGSSHFTTSTHTSGGTDQRRVRGNRGSMLGAAASLPPVKPPPDGVLPPTPEKDGNAMISSSTPALIEPRLAHQQDGERVTLFTDPIDGKSYAIPPSILKAFLSAGIKLEDVAADGRETEPAITASQDLLFPSLANRSQTMMARQPSGTSMTRSVSSMGESQTTPLNGFLDLPAMEPPLRSPGGTLILEADGTISIGHDGTAHIGNPMETMEKRDLDVLGSHSTSNDGDVATPELPRRLRRKPCPGLSEWEDEGDGMVSESER